MDWNKVDETGMPELFRRINKFITTENYKFETRIPPNKIFPLLKGATHEDMIHLCMYNNITDPKLYNKIIKNCRSFRDVETNLINYFIENGK